MSPQGDGFADGSAAFLGSDRGFDLADRLDAVIVIEGKRADAVGKTGKGDDADQIMLAPGKVFAPGNEVLHHVLDHFQAIDGMTVHLEIHRSHAA